MLPTPGQRKREFENIDSFGCMRCILFKQTLVLVSIALGDGNDSMGERSFILGGKTGKNFMGMFGPALGIIFGCALGILAGLITGNELLASAGIGAGIGLVAGAAASAFYYNMVKS